MTHLLKLNTRNRNPSIGNYPPLTPSLSKSARKMFDSREQKRRPGPLSYHVDNTTFKKLKGGALSKSRRIDMNNTISGPGPGDYDGNSTLNSTGFRFSLSKKNSI